MIYIEDIIPNCISFSELENHTLSQAELNEIKYIKENNKIFEVPGQNENLRLRTLVWT
jgi:hypothetical protein